MNNWIKMTMLATVAVVGRRADAADQVNTEAALRQRIAAFVNAGDSRDSAAMKEILHDDFRLLVYAGDSREVRIIDKSAYLQAISAGKIGGVARQLTIVSVEMRGAQAACRIRMKSTALKFDNFMQWVVTADGWQLINDLAHTVPAK